MARALVVDDAAFMRMTIKQMLEANGHSMAGEAATGVEAVERYLDVKPDFIILDISMPEMNGIEALKRIKVLDPDAKAIVCTAIGQQVKLAEAIEAGALEFIVKPFEAAQLMQAIDKVMS